MSREERRAAFEKLSPEERAAMRERRRGEGSTGASPAAAVSTSGFSSDTARAPRRATVRLLTTAGTLEDRQVELGISNRVQTQILSGLAEGDQVVAGLKLPPATTRSGSSAQPGGGLQQGPARLPPGAAPRGR